MTFEAKSIVEWGSGIKKSPPPMAPKSLNFPDYRILVKQIQALLGNNRLRDSQNRDDESRHHQNRSGLATGESASYQEKAPFRVLCNASENPGVWGRAPSQIGPF
jgi:hypothetical protein